MAQRSIFFDTSQPFEERLELVVNTVKSLSSTSDPVKMVEVFGAEVGNVLQRDATISLTRRHVPPPKFQISRFSEWEDPFDPWKNPELMPILEGGLLGDLLFENRSVVMVDFKIDETDPAYEYLKNYRSLMSLPTFDNREALNMTILLGKEPDAFDEDLLPEIVWTGNLFGRAVHNLRVGEELKKAHEIIDNEVKVVAEIQNSLLPEELPEIPGMEIAVHYDAAQRAGGDYYDFFELPSGKWGILIADVSGHGPSAAVLMAITHALAHTNPEINDDPAVMLNFINKHLILTYTNKTKSFVTAFYAIYDPATHLMRYASAGHDAPLVLHSTDCTFEIPEATNNVPLGVREIEVYESREFQLAPGDFIVLFTDGIFEVHNKDNELYGMERFTEAVRQCTETPQAIIDSLLDDIQAFTDNQPAHDDQTLLIAKIQGG